MALKDLFSDIASAIREKDKSTDPIVAEDFPDRIRAISTIDITLESINITKPPEITAYAIGSEFNLDGIEVKATFSNGHKFALDQSYLTYVPSGPLAKGTDHVDIIYTFGKQQARTSQPINVRLELR